jgi:hypothetical protein
MWRRWRWLGWRGGMEVGDRWAVARQVLDACAADGGLAVSMLASGAEAV